MIEWLAAKTPAQYSSQVPISRPNGKVLISGSILAAPPVYAVGAGAAFAVLYPHTNKSTAGRASMYHVFYTYIDTIYPCTNAFGVIVLFGTVRSGREP